MSSSEKDTYLCGFHSLMGGEKINGKLCGTLEGFKDLITAAVLNSAGRADILEKVTFKQRLEGNK